MDFIEINDEITFRKSDISGIQRIDKDACNIITNTGSMYSCTWPYSTMVKLLQTSDSDNRVTSINKTQNLWGAQHFAG